MNSLETTVNLWNQLQGTLGSIAGDLVNQTIGQLTNELNNTFNSLLGSLSGFLTGKRALQASQIYSVIQDAQLAINSLLTSGSLNLTSLFQQFQSQVNTFLSTLTNPNARSVFLTSVAQTKGDIMDAFGELLNQAMGHLTDIATSLANVGLATILNTLSGKRGLLDGFTDIFSGLTSTLSGHIDNLTTSIVQVGSSLLDATTPLLQDLQDQLTVHALNAAQSLLGTLAGISSTLQGKRGLWDDLLGQLGTMTTSLTSSLQQVGSDLLGAVTPHLQDLQDQLTVHALNAAQSLLGTLSGISTTLQG